LDRKKAVAVEWISPRAQTFAVAMSSGFVELYKAETDKQAPLKTINLNTRDIELVSMFALPLIP
jgi:hypothetical protein